MNRNALVAASVAALLVPVSFAALLWRAALHPRTVLVAVDPFEIDLQLHARNDDE